MRNSCPYLYRLCSLLSPCTVIRSIDTSSFTKADAGRSIRQVPFGIRATFSSSLSTSSGVRHDVQKFPSAALISDWSTMNEADSLDSWEVSTIVRSRKMRSNIFSRKHRSKEMDAAMASAFFHSRCFTKACNEPRN
ncbi:unnamed protein product [Victoria cruziana]